MVRISRHLATISVLACFIGCATSDPWSWDAGIDTTWDPAVDTSTGDVPVDSPTDTPVDLADVPIDAVDVPGDTLADTMADTVVDTAPDCMDSDADTICDTTDVCDGGDDHIDTDYDGVPDWCDCDTRSYMCHSEATCTDGTDGVDCTCNEGWDGDGATCTAIDHCFALTHTCDVNATCTYTGPGTYDCDCNFGFTGDGFTCTPVSTTGGHAVLIGHDYYSRSTDTDNIVGNAVFLAATTGTVSVLAYNQYSDNTSSGEPANTDAAIDARATALGRSWTRTYLTDYTLLSSSLTGHDVLLVYEQENSTATALTSIGTGWASTLATFLASGGVVIACDHNMASGGTWGIMHGAGLMTITGTTDISYDTITVVQPSDPLMSSVANPYAAINGSVSFITTETDVISQSSAGAPVVIHKSY